MVARAIHHLMQLQARVVSHFGCCVAEQFIRVLNAAMRTNLVDLMCVNVSVIYDYLFALCVVQLIGLISREREEKR